MCSTVNSLKSTVIFLACAIFVMVAAGCMKDMRFELPPNETLTVLVYGGGRPLTERQITPLSKEHHLLAVWLAANSRGWSPTPATYVPGVYVKGKGFSINFLKSMVIINFQEGQYIKSVDPKSYEFLLENSRT
jgi:hypothetical protein